MSNTDHYYSIQASEYNERYYSDEVEPVNFEKQCPGCKELFDKTETILCDGVCPECEKELEEYETV